MAFTKLHPEIKMSETKTHVFFLNGPFSQWHPSDFLGKLSVDAEPIKFNCCEQYMMASKAVLFGDTDTFRKIMEVEQDSKDWRKAPKRQKELGREVSGFDPALWDAQCRDIVFRGNWYKFNQNADFEDFLMNTADLTLVEGAHYDRIWGVGLAWDDPAIIDPKNWQGTNYLGKALMKVRYWMDEYGSMAHMSPYSRFDEFKQAIV